MSTWVWMLIVVWTLVAGLAAGALTAWWVTRQAMERRCLHIQTVLTSGQHHPTSAHATAEKALPPPWEGCVFFINRAQDTDRRAHMEKLLASCGWAERSTRIEAFTPDTIPDNIRQQLNPRLFAKRGSDGCFASHLAVLERIAALPTAAWGIVLEDDTAPVPALEGLGIVAKHTNIILKDCPQHVGAVWLGVWPRASRRVRGMTGPDRTKQQLPQSLTQLGHHYTSKRVYLATHAYAMRPWMARAFLHHFRANPHRVSRGPVDVAFQKFFTRVAAKYSYLAVVTQWTDEEFRGLFGQARQQFGSHIEGST